jgi:formylglycine-generating enzyme required for sulfatase activity
MAPDGVLMRPVLSLLLSVLGMVTAALPAVAEKRVALVVGNSAYRNVAPLDNPKNDAALMAETLRGLGFALVGGGARLNLDKAGLDAAVQVFGAQLQGADVALFYYAGHGIQLRGANYLVPVDANPTKEADVDFQMLDSNTVLRQMESAGSRLNLAILDACRNNPFGGRGLRATDSGLAQMRAPEGTLISFATQPGAVAQDGTNGNSPFTRALAQTIRRPGLDVFRTFNEVGLAVTKATGGAQQPWVSSSPITGEFYFAGPLEAPGGKNGPGGGAPADADAGMRADLALAQKIDKREVWQAILDKYPTGLAAAAARARLEEFNKSEVALVASPVQPALPCGGAGALASLSSRAPRPLSAAEECALKPKDVFKECDKCPEMVVVPAGSFTMGSPASEPERQDFEGPQHVVSFSRSFAVGKFHVTVDQFAAFVSATGYDAGSECWSLKNELAKQSWRDPGVYRQNGTYPAACLNWIDSKAYVAWLAQTTGKPYRLLSEAEWEYAARGRTTPGPAPRYFFGDDERAMCRYGNGMDQSMKSSFVKKWASVPSDMTFFSCSDGYISASPVGSFLPNVFGLYDMHGNVWQWTEDCFHDSYQDAPTDGSAWTADDCSRRISRGGSWTNAPFSLRSAIRNWNYPDYRYTTYGFRVARTLAP